MVNRVGLKAPIGKAARPSASTRATREVYAGDTYMRRKNGLLISAGKADKFIFFAISTDNENKARCRGLFLTYNWPTNQNKVDVAPVPLISNQLNYDYT